MGIVGVAAGLAALLQNDDLLAGLGRPNSRHHAGAGAHHHHVGLQPDGVMAGRLHRVAGLLMAGAGMAHLGTEAALDTLVLVDLILGSHKVDGLHGTVAGTVVAASTERSVYHEHFISSFLPAEPGFSQRYYSGYPPGCSILKNRTALSKMEQGHTAVFSLPQVSRQCQYALGMELCL